MNLEVFRSEAAACTACHTEPPRIHVDESSGRARPLFDRVGTGSRGVLFVAEAPNFADTFEAGKGYLTVGDDTDPSGQQANALLREAGLRHEEALFTNAALCLPALRSRSYPVSAKQQRACVKWLERLIEVADPRVVVTLGVVALRSAALIEDQGLTLASAVGRLHDWHGRKLLPLYHPGKRAQLTRKAPQQLADIRVLRDFLAESPARRFRFSVHAELSPAPQELGVLVYSEDARDISYLPWPGARRGTSVEEVVTHSRAKGGDHRAAIEYLRERGGGAYASMSVPASLWADSLEAACAAVAARFGFPSAVFVDGPAVALDPAEAARLVADCEGGARLTLSCEGATHERIVVAVGLRTALPTVFAFIPFAAELPLGFGTRFVSVGRLERIETGWSFPAEEIGGRRVSIRVERLGDAERADVREWLNSLGPNALGHFEDTLRTMLDPALL